MADALRTLLKSGYRTSIVRDLEMITGMAQGLDGSLQFAEAAEKNQRFNRSFPVRPAAVWVLENINITLKDVAVQIDLLLALLKSQSTSQTGENSTPGEVIE